MDAVRSKNNTAWAVFYVAIFILIVTIIWSLFLTFGEGEEENRSKHVQGATFAWFLTLALLFVGMYLALSPVQK